MVDCIWYMFLTESRNVMERFVSFCSSAQKEQRRDEGLRERMREQEERGKGGGGKGGVADRVREAESLCACVHE